MTYRLDSAHRYLTINQAPKKQLQINTLQTSQQGKTKKKQPNY